MHRSKLPLTVWFWAAHLMATHSNGMSALQFEAQLGITYKTAWLLAQKPATIDDRSARLVRDHARARLAPSPDELLGYRRPRQSSQRRADRPTPAATPKDSNRHAAGWFKPPSKLPRQHRFGCARSRPATPPGPSDGCRSWRPHG